MILKSWCLILVGTIISFKSVICDRCNADYKIPDEAKYHCYMKPTKHVCSSDSIRIRSANISEDGIVEVKFDYEPNCHYKLVLGHWRKINDEQKCDKNGMPTTEVDDYAIYTYSADRNENLPKCINDQEKMGTGVIKLKYLYKGCYNMKLIKMHPNDTKELSSFTIKQKYFDLSNTQLKYSDFESNKNHWYYNPNKNVTELVIRHAFLRKLPNINLIITDKKTHACTKPSCGDFLFSPSSNNSETVIYNLCDKEYADPGITCEVTGDELKCNIKYLDEGNYTLEFFFANLIQCPYDLGTIFGTCGGKGEPLIEPRTSITPPLEDNFKPIYWVVFGLGCITILLILALIVFRRKNRKGKELRKMPRLISYPEKTSFDGESQVLLLYAKDAEKVMETMASLRKALEAKGFKVYDVFDQKQQESIDEFQSKWITHKLSNRYMKTIIVQTYCGQILSKSSLPAEKLYKKPTCYDCYFQYALSLIRERKDSNDYTKLFIANMGFDKMDYTEFTFLNPSTRFGLPDNFAKLAQELHENCTIDICQNDKELDEFNIKYKEMKAYIEDPNYLSEILKVSISPFNDKFEIEETLKKGVNV